MTLKLLIEFAKTKDVYWFLSNRRVINVLSCFAHKCYVRVHMT